MKVSSPYPVLDNRPIDQWKVTELKEELKRRKLTIKGLKEDLIKRLDEAIRNKNESTGGNTDNGSDDIPQPVLQTEDSGTVSAVNESTGDMTDHGNERNEVDGVMDPAQVDETVSLGEGKVQEGEVKVSTDSARDEEMVVGATSVGTSITVIETVVSEMAINVEESDNSDSQNGRGDLESQLKVGTDSVRDEEMVVDATSVETSITVNESVVSEIAINVQESQNTDSQDGRGDLESQQENEEIKPPHEDIELNSSDPINQVSEVSTVLGFQVNSDSISSDCLSINEKNELKDNIIAANVKLELEVKPEMVQPSSTNVLPDGGRPHPMDVEDPHENEVPVDEGDDNKAVNAEMSKKNDSSDVVSSEKLNLDRSSGDDSMEDDALESRQIISMYNPDEGVDRNEKTEAPVVQVDISANKEDIHHETDNAPAAPTVKRKPHAAFTDQVVGNNETSKRQRRWNSENLKVPEPQSNIASSTTPKDMFPSTTSKRNFSRSNSAASEDAPKERVVPPSPKPPTNSLRIDRFLRPFTLKAVQELLGKTGTIASLWMDHIKTHCYVTYSSMEEAIETRNAVYNLQWPPNGGRLLVAEFVDPQEVKLRAEAPPQSPATPVGPRPTVPPTPPVVQPPQPSPRQLVQRQQLPPPPSLPPPPPLSNPPQAREMLPLPPPPPLPEKVDPPIVTLDDLFRKTKATPRIYYLPLSDEQVAAKLKAHGKSTKQ
ncbi:Apoptotic chromatin condensation inducer in the nucleus like [Actinidia chinensis var. chinensis]|uniref:Apoptotic chromatin condensation inducer in the nucleus like n=1 Tax=Actinidia chinensis var. chinensis TaxID=1590841 RepID=A0A2R6R689_ACTCC|nr:Apoptotic chromatin condensation inducer in the nucleus like [Actinidia chinensis var. chinensis]